MNGSVKKKLIQKIRNRMSAQRSRMKQRLHYKNMEKENRVLKAKVNGLILKNHQLIFQNSKLMEEIENFTTYYCKFNKADSKSLSEK